MLNEICSIFLSVHLKFISSSYFISLLFFKCFYRIYRFYRFRVHRLVYNTRSLLCEFFYDHELPISGIRILDLWIDTRNNFHSLIQEWCSLVQRHARKSINEKIIFIGNRVKNKRHKFLFLFTSSDMVENFPSLKFKQPTVTIHFPIPVSSLSNS